tara:strand:- start:509 stop:2728 length:2220 start_codon:yes stop_codon:yes gene_type:complete
MSLLVCSSAQDKYEETSNLVAAAGNEIPTSILAPGIQNPSQFTNNINPVMVIPANSEVALKDISFYRKSMFKVGINVSMAIYVGELLKSKFGLIASKTLHEVTSCPVPIPLQPGTYNSSTFATMVTNALNTYVGYPDLFNKCNCEAWTSAGDGVNDKGYVFDFQKGAGVLAPPNRAADMTTAQYIFETRHRFLWNVAPLQYLNTDARVGVLWENQGTLTNYPLSLNGGAMEWEVSNCTGGWRIGLQRPIVGRGRRAPAAGNSVGTPFCAGRAGAHLFASDGHGFLCDYIMEYDTRTDGAYADTEMTFRLYHLVAGDANGYEYPCMREVEYYNNVAAEFTPGLNTYAPAKAHMYSGAAATATALGANPSNITIEMMGEDSVVTITAGGTNYVMTDSRLCIAGNPVVATRTPTRNRFFKPTGTMTCALYPSISLKVNAEYGTLVRWGGITEEGYEYPLPHHVPNPVILNAPAVSPTGKATSGSSPWGRAQRWQNGENDFANLSYDLWDALPYQSNSAIAQKQYIGLDGPTSVAPAVPVRIGEGNPLIPNPATGTGNVAYAVALITCPSSTRPGEWKTQPGAYITDTSDVSELLGFRDTSLVAQSLVGNTYTFANKPVANGHAPPTNTNGAYFGWYVGSTSTPTYSSGSLYLRCPTLTHQSYNFGKGIPSKIIASIPADSMDTNTMSGDSYYAPSELTYLTLNNSEDLNFNDITLEIVDKNEQIVDILDRNTTATLHFRKSR